MTSMDQSLSLILELFHCTGRVTATSCLQYCPSWSTYQTLSCPSQISKSLIYVASTFKSLPSQTSQPAQGLRLIATFGKVTGHLESYLSAGPTTLANHQPAEESRVRHTTCYSQTQQSQIEYSLCIAFVDGSQTQSPTNSGLHILIQ